MKAFTDVSELHISAVYISDSSRKIQDEPVENTRTSFAHPGITSASSRRTPPSSHAKLRWSRRWRTVALSSTVHRSSQASPFLDM